MNETPTSSAELTVRSAEPGDHEALLRLNEAAFGSTGPPDYVNPWVQAYSEPYSQVATEGDDVVGAAAAFKMQLTLPGGARLDCPGVTGVSVAPTHRRRGILKKMMWRQLAEIRRGGAPLCALTATEATIYEQFGYGVAADFVEVSIDTRRAQFRTQPGAGRLQLIDAKEAHVLLPQIHEGKVARRAGMTNRPQQLWDHHFADQEVSRGGNSAWFHVIHLDANEEPDGYVAYRVEEVETINGYDNVVWVDQLVGIRPSAEVELWRYVCSIDLANRVRAIVEVDQPIRHLLTDPRAVQTTARRDHLWLRIVDFAAVLTARSYEWQGEIVIGSVDWEFTSNTGQFRIVVEDGKATVSRTEDKPVAVADISAWATLLLGGGDARHLLLAGRLQGDPMAVNRCFRTSSMPWNDVDF